MKSSLSPSDGPNPTYPKLLSYYYEKCPVYEPCPSLIVEGKFCIYHIVNTFLFSGTVIELAEIGQLSILSFPYDIPFFK